MFTKASLHASRLTLIFTALNGVSAQVISVAPATPSYGSAIVSSAPDADHAWSGLLSLATRRLNQQALSAGPAANSTQLLSQSDQFIQASLGAKEFYTLYPGDARAAQAKMFEALYALESVQVGAGSYQTTANALGAAYVADQSNTAENRFDVAMAMEAIALAPALHGTQLIDDGATYEKMADDLYTELGGSDQVYSVYVSIVRTTDPATASSEASKILGMATAPAWAKAEAQLALDRIGLIGQPVALQLTTVGGATIDLNLPGAQPTVIYFWNGTTGGADLSLLATAKPAIPAGARWIYVALGGAAAPSAAALAQAPFAGSSVFERSQLGGPLASAFKVSQTPYACVLSPAGIVTGFGSPGRLAALLSATAP